MSEGMKNINPILQRTVCCCAMAVTFFTTCSCKEIWSDICKWRVKGRYKWDTESDHERYRKVRKQDSLCVHLYSCVHLWIRMHSGYAMYIGCVCVCNYVYTTSLYALFFIRSLHPSLFLTCSSSQTYVCYFADHSLYANMAISSLRFFLCYLQLVILNMIWEFEYINCLYQWCEYVLMQTCTHECAYVFLCLDVHARACVRTSRCTHV